MQFLVSQNTYYLLSTYDLSSIVSASVAMGKPIIAASMNYRLGRWGFLAAKELSEFNFGLYNQRLLST